MSHCYFFPTLVRLHDQEKGIWSGFEKMTALGLQPFLIYPAVIKLRHKGEQRSYDSPQNAEDFISSLSAVSPSRREGRDGQDEHGRLLTYFLRFLLSSLLLGYCPYLSGTTISLLVRLTLHFSFLEGTNGE